MNKRLRSFKIAMHQAFGYSVQPCLDGSILIIYERNIENRFRSLQAAIDHYIHAIRDLMPSELTGQD